MLLDKIIKVKVSNRTKKYFFDKEYEDIDGFFMVKPEDMNSTNRTKVDCKCDYCGKINSITWCSYIVQVGVENITCCHKCHYNKSKIVFLKNFGVENPASLVEIKDKVKKTCFEKYGFDSPFHNEEIKNKIKATFLEKYGTNIIVDIEGVKEKIKKTNLEKYGSEHIFDKNSILRKDIDIKAKESFITNKFEINEKKKKTCLEKYGVECSTKSNVVKNKTKTTNLEKYGVEYVLQLDDVKNKSKITCLEKYGVDHYTRTKEYSERAKNTRIKLVLQIPDELKSDFENYRKKVDNLTKKLKKKLFQNWNGYDYYDNEYIIDNFKYKFHSNLYPTIDHKISVYYGYLNNISPEEISKFDNLCITKRKINSSKQSKNEDVYTL
jgi:hypothetical protein